MTDKELKEYLEKPETQQMATMLAMQFMSITENWFTPKRIQKKVKGFTEEEIKSKLTILTLLGLTGMKEDKGEIKYKVTISNDQKLNYLRSVKKDLEGDLKEVNDEIEKLSEPQ